MSVPFLVDQAQSWTGAQRLQGDASGLFDAVSIDSRTLPKGALFIAIAGERHDAHHFLLEVARYGRFTRTRHTDNYEERIASLTVSLHR